MNPDSDCCNNSAFYLLASIKTGVYSFVSVTTNVPWVGTASPATNVHQVNTTLTKLAIKKTIVGSIESISQFIEGIFSIPQ